MYYKTYFTVTVLFLFAYITGNGQVSILLETIDTVFKRGQLQTSFKDRFNIGPMILLFEAFKRVCFYFTLLVNNLTAASWFENVGNSFPGEILRRLHFQIQYMAESLCSNKYNGTHGVSLTDVPRNFPK